LQVFPVESTYPAGQLTGWQDPVVPSEYPVAQMGFCTGAQFTEAVEIVTCVFAQVAASKVAADPVVMSVTVAVTL
jgi:uncharacterized membrane protein